MVDLYGTNNIYITTAHPYTWKDEVRKRIETVKADQYVIAAPHKVGKTKMAIDMAYEFANNGNDVLFVTASAHDAEIVVLTLRVIKECKVLRKDGACLLRTERGTILVPYTEDALNSIMLSGDMTDVIIADGCEVFSNEKLHCLAMKGAISNAMSIYFGAEELGKTNLNKSVWKWFMNHPACDVTKVIECDTIKTSHSVGLDLDIISKLFAAPPCVA